MTSRDFGFITLRNAVAYRPDNSVVPPNNVFITSTNGGAVFSSNLKISTIDALNATIDTLKVSTITGVNTLDVSTINAKAINTSSLNTNSLNTNSLNTSSINTSTIKVTSLIALPTATAPSNVLYTDTSKLYFNGLLVNTGVISTVSTVYWKPAGDGTTGVITNTNEGNPISNLQRYLVGVGTNFSTDTRSTLNGTLDIQYRGGNATGNSLYISSNGNEFNIKNIFNSNLVDNTIQLNLNNNNPDYVGASLSFNKSNNFSVSNDGAEMGYLEFRGTDVNLSSMRTAYIISHQQGAAGDGYVPGTLEFFTTADLDSVNSVQRMIISSSGQVGINTPAPYKQLQVSTTTKDALDGIASNSADVNTIIGSYNQGTFTSNVGSIQVTNGNNSATPFTLALNPRGGNVYIGSSIGSTFINGVTTISTLITNTINGVFYDPTQDTHWSAYEYPPLSGTYNAFNTNNGAVGIGTNETIATGITFQVDGNSLFNGQISTSNLTTPYVSSVNNSLVLGGEVYISSSAGDDFAQLHLFNDKAKITTNGPYNGMFLETSGNMPITLASTLGVTNNNIFATFGPTKNWLYLNTEITPTSPSSISAFKIQLNSTNITDDANGSNLYVWRGPGTDSTYLTNNGGGSVYIGTTDDTGAYSSTLQIGPTGNISVSGQGIFTSTNITNSKDGLIELRPDGDNGNVIRFGGSGPIADTLIFMGSGDAERMRINVAGNVGIGTTTPATNLVVNSVIPSISTGFAVQSGDVYTVIGNVENGGDNYGSIQVTQNGTDTTINNTNPWPLVIQPIGGSTTTGGDFVVSGSAGIGTTVNASYRLYVSGDIYATGNITAGSDIRFKTAINTLENALSTVKNLRGVSYTTIDTQRKNIGVIAQEIEKVLPEVVITDTTENQFKSVAYGNIVGVLIEAIKELSGRVDNLEKLIHTTE